jgi:subtilisin family serine protease
MGGGVLRVDESGGTPRRRSLAALVVAALTALLAAVAAGPTAPAAGAVDAPPGTGRSPSALVQVEAPPSGDTSGASTLDDPGMVAVVDTGDGLEVLTADVDSPADAVEFAQAADAAGEVVSLEPDSVVVPAGLALAQVTKTWAYSKLELAGVHATDVGAGIVVAVIDTAVAANHVELSGQVLGGYDAILDEAVAAGTGVFDLGDGAHGTHVAAIVAARRGVGEVVGVAPGAKILPVRAITPQGGVASDVAEGIIWAVDHGAHVVNLSLTSPVQSSAITNAIQYAVNRGVIVVAAGGNSGTSGNTASWPAADENTVAVAATDVRDIRWHDSTTGPYIDLAAPGVDIYSAAGGTSDYAYLRGTSMASPMVAGTVALIRAAAPTLTVAQVRAALSGTALDLGPLGADQEYGSGRIRPAHAIAHARHLAAMDRMLVATAAPGRVQLRWTPPPGVAVARYDLYVDGALAAQLPASTTRWDDVGRERPGGSVYQVRMLVAGPGGLGTAATTHAVRAAPLRTAAGAGQGYWVLTSRGRLLPFGGVGWHGNSAASTAPVVAGASTASARGYWLARSNGKVEAFGDARFLGDVSHLPLNQPIVAMVPTPDGRGYYLTASDGGIFTHGSARFLGSTGNLRLNQPVVDITLDSDGVGYWMVARDGGVFSFAAPFRGSMGGQRLNMPVNSIATTPGGYVLSGRDGGIFNFGSVFYGSIPGVMPLASPAVAPDVIRIDSVRDGRGYLMVSTDGRVMAFGDAPFYGSASSQLLPGETAADILVSPLV